jgi:hypothetical protein
MPRKGKVIRFPGPSTPTSESGLVEVHRCDRSEALVIKSLFESAGIPTLLKSPLAQSVHPFSVGAQGEIVVMVAGPDAAHSRLILARIAPGPSFP